MKLPIPNTLWRNKKKGTEYGVLCNAWVVHGVGCYDTYTVYLEYPSKQPGLNPFPVRHSENDKWFGLCYYMGKGDDDYHYLGEGWYIEWFVTGGNNSFSRDLIKTWARPSWMWLEKFEAIVPEGYAQEDSLYEHK